MPSYLVWSAACCVSFAHTDVIGCRWHSSTVAVAAKLHSAARYLFLWLQNWEEEEALEKSPVVIIIAMITAVILIARCLIDKGEDTIFVRSTQYIHKTYI